MPGGYSLDQLRAQVDELLNDPFFGLVAFVVVLLVRLRVWEWIPPRKPKHKHRHKAA